MRMIVVVVVLLGRRYKLELDKLELDIPGGTSWS
jgi:hypothetical protein